MISFTYRVVIIAYLHIGCINCFLSKRSTKYPLNKRAISPQADEIWGWDSQSANQFLDKYWQKKPVLIRSALPNVSNLRFDKLGMFNLACEEDVESRLLVKRGRKWTKEYGPFDEETLDTLPEKDWTLLVQVKTVPNTRLNRCLTLDN